MSNTNLIATAVQKMADVAGTILFADVLFFLPNVQLPFLIFWVMLACVFFTFKLRFVNFRHFADSFKIFLQKEKQDDSGKTITSRSAFLGAISGCVGVGSVAGVAAAIFYGGPGVVFWLMVAAFLSMPVRFAEVYLGHYYRKKDDEGNITSYGPFAYIKHGLPEMNLSRFAKLFCTAFAICLIFTSFSAMMGQVVPTVELISHIFFDESKVAMVTIAFLIGLFTLIVIVGGLSRMSNVIQKLAVAMSLIYIVSIFVIIGMNFKSIPNAVKLIFDSAFEIKSIYGGMLGTIIVAFTRIISMNEIGMGTVAILHGKSKNENSAKEAMLAMAGPFVAILVFVALNSFAVVVSGSHEIGVNGIIMINQMFGSVHFFLSVALILIMLLFAITTLIAWYFYTETAIKELKRGDVIVKFYPLFFIVFITFCALVPFGVMLQFMDVIGISIIIPNIVILYILASKVKKGLDKYEKSKV